MIKEILIVAASYPTKDDPVYAFIRPVVCGLADLGIHVTVLSPQSITNTIKRRAGFRPYHWIDRSGKGSTVDIYQPKYISVSQMKRNGLLLSQRAFEIALRRALIRLKIKPDLVYAHFWESVVAACHATKEKSLPIIAVSGEEHVSVFENYPSQRVFEAVTMVKGLICVSTKNLEECKKLRLTSPVMKTEVIPNAVDPVVFHQIDKKEVRKKLRLPQDAMVAIYVGEFSKRKGVNRLIEAAKTIPDLKLILVGTGDSLLNTDQVFFSGTLAHDEIPIYLNAADFFVLPTLAEGCCNAIVEALACGLPVISSNLSFNDDILSDENSIRINPMSIQEISNAITTLYENQELRTRLSNGALETAKGLTIEERAKRILGFIAKSISSE